MVALAAELFAPEVHQVLRPIEIVKAVPLGHGGAVGEILLQPGQLVLGHGVEGQGDALFTAVSGDLPEVLCAAPAQGQGEGLPQGGVLDLEI